MDANDRQAKVGPLRHALLDLHRALIDEQRKEYERARGRVETRGEFLGLVLNHPEFEWIRALSALIAQLDEWAEDTDAASEPGYQGIVEALRSLIRPDGTNVAFSERYWKMVDGSPDVTVPHVKAWRMASSKP